MPTVHSGHKTLVHYPDGTSKVITLYVPPSRARSRPRWEVTSVAPAEDDGAEIEYQISVARPAKELEPPEAPFHVRRDPAVVRPQGCSEQHGDR